MDIEKWLCSLGLQEYVTAFRENNVEADVLLRRTAEDVKDIRVSSVGRPSWQPVAARMGGPDKAPRGRVPILISFPKALSNASTGAGRSRPSVGLCSNSWKPARGGTRASASGLGR
ncbi:hypothetical protein [Bradyrhizobium sp. CCGB12]|uniref:hypothetical protein n=1 Tax=Bradyrhizobium sp. CCGB12 TaxID=2949632 RepID=UPI0035BF1902